jgi:polysaccharide export outer membrane protein
MIGAFRAAALMITLITGYHLTACASPTEGLTRLQDAGSTAYRMEAGDKIRVAIQDADPPAAEYTIDESGSVSLPLISNIVVRGMTNREAEAAIQNELISRGIFRHPLVTVEAVELRPFYVLGEVNRPGEYQFRQGTTVLAAVSVAGGYTYRAKTSVVAVTRTIEGRQITSAATEHDLVMPGDRIRVYERWF